MLFFYYFHGVLNECFGKRVFVLIENGKRSQETSEARTEVRNKRHIRVQ